MLLALNCIDAVMTWHFVRTGVATEANPAMAFVLGQSAMAFFVVKILAVDIFAIFLSRYRQQAALAVMVVAFAFVDARHAAYLLTGTPWPLMSIRMAAPVAPQQLP